MPQALGLLLPASLGSTVSVFGITVATASGLTLAGSLLNVTSSLALSAGLNALFAPGRPEPPSPTNLQVNSKVARGARYGHYGWVLTGGNTIFHRASDGVSFRIVAHGHGEMDGVEQYLLDAANVSLDATGRVTNAQYFYLRERVQILQRLGVVPETHYQELTDIWPEWTSNHRLDGLWSSLIICQSVPPEQFRAMYPADEPTLTAIARGRRVYDPRTGTTAFSENAALIINDYVTSPDGMNAGDVFDPDELAIEADACDIDASLAAGGTEKLWRLAGSFSLNERPQDVLARMLTACGGEIRLKPDGKMRLRVGRSETPTVTITLSDIVSVSNFNTGPDILTKYNTLPGRFNSQELGYIEVDAEQFADEDRIARDGQPIVGEQADFIMAPSHRQCRAGMKLKIELDNPLESLTVQLKPKALETYYERVVNLDVPELGLIGTYKVNRPQLTFDSGLLKGVTLDLNLFNQGANTLGLDEQGTVQEEPAAYVSSGVPAPQNVVAAAAGTQVSANTFAAGIGVGWQIAPSDALTPVLKYSVSGQEQFQPVGVDPGVVSYVISALADGGAYDITLALASPSGVVGPEVRLNGIIASAATDPPNAPTGLLVDESEPGIARVRFTASTSANLWRSEIYRDGTLVEIVYGGPGAAVTFFDACGSGTFDWTVRAVNVSGLDSLTDAGPVSATIT